MRLLFHAKLDNIFTVIMHQVLVIREYNGREYAQLHSLSCRKSSMSAAPPSKYRALGLAASRSLQLITRYRLATSVTMLRHELPGNRRLASLRFIISRRRYAMLHYTLADIAYQSPDAALLDISP